MDIWYYDSYLDRTFQHSLSEEKIQEFAQLDIDRPRKDGPIYFFARLSTEE